tara:strand:- start:96 stop:851 length:756 start_codon:yes stop_codon:yes gene_type:complete
MDPILIFKLNHFAVNNWWRIRNNTKGYKNEIGDNLVTEILKNRIFRIIEPNLEHKDFLFKSRLLVQLFEDGYKCWINIDNLEIEEYPINIQEISIPDKALIQQRIPKILEWINKQTLKTNQYLWGGTLGPNYDCSGLIQTAFLKHGIYLPRDSYEMKSFCRHVISFPGNIEILEIGDLLFFGENNKCNHVGIYCGDGNYYHSSGKDYGRNRIGIDNLIEYKRDVISNYYYSKLISAGRVIENYRWDTTLVY